MECLFSAQVLAENKRINGTPVKHPAAHAGFAKAARDWQAKQIGPPWCHCPSPGTSNRRRQVACTQRCGARVWRSVSDFLSALRLADQASKLKMMTQAGTGIKVVHLYEMSAGSVQAAQLLQDTQNLPSSWENTLLLFSPLQQTCLRKSWAKQLPCVISAWALKMAGVDKAHLCAMHRLCFRPKLFKLKEIPFDKMKNSDAPVVLVTATATEEMTGCIKRFSGLDVLPENIAWPGSEGVQR